MYNVDMMVDSTGKPYKLPNTTDELVDLCLTLYSDGTTPFCHYADYWYYVYEAWIAQYEGEEAFYDIWNFVYTDENGVKYPNDVRAITESKGRYEAYKVLEDLLSPKGYTYTNCNSFNHTTAQTYFLNGYAAMQPNGSWIENEMGGGDAAANILPMRTPVISALADKLEVEAKNAELAERILNAWRGYSDEAAFIFSHTDGIPHNTITPIARRRGEDYEMDLVLRNNITTEEHPLGVFHPHAELHHIKKENIGLIEVMGLAVLPSRLKQELAQIEDAILMERPLTGELEKHAPWVDELKKTHKFTVDNTACILKLEVGKVFAKVLEHAGVFKRDLDGAAAFDRFIRYVNREV